MSVKGGYLIRLLWCGSRRSLYDPLREKVDEEAARLGVIKSNSRLLRKNCARTLVKWESAHGDSKIVFLTSTATIR